MVVSNRRNREGPLQSASLERITDILHTIVDFALTRLNYRAMKADLFIPSQDYSQYLRDIYYFDW